MKLSLVIPCYNEEGNVRKFFDLVNLTFENKICDQTKVYNKKDGYPPPFL